MPRSRLLWLVVLVAMLQAGSSLPAEDKPVDFAHDVLPLLKTHCAKCHTNGTYKGDFSMETRTALLESGTVKPGKPDISDLIIRVESVDPELRMPPQGDPLTAEQVAILKRWIASDLPWTDGFSFKAAKSKKPLALQPVTIPPATPQSGSHPLDRLLADYAHKQQVTLPEPASDEVFLRRLSLDVIGLLPTDDEVKAFVADASTDKHTTAIDQVLARRSDYAMHWLTFWNDLLRNDYAGTGFIDGGRKQITGWLVKALYNNLPYDQFVRQLIAPDADSEGFAKGIIWRGRVNASQIPELQFSQNVGQVFLGINLKCASCHDSFIDEWTLNDAYGLAAIVAEKPLEIHRCDIPSGKFAETAFVFPELGTIDGSLAKLDRQKRLAELLVDPRNGRLPRTVVNRIWRQLMGRGLVEPVDSMAGDAWSEEVLDYLSAYLVENNYDLQKLIRHIVTSKAWQARTVMVSKEPASGDGYVFTGPITRRMTAEQFVDALWMLTGQGPDKVDKAFNGLTEQVASQGLKVRAACVISDPLMRSLGRPNREQVVTTRPELLTTLQALDLSNGPELASLVEKGAAHLLKDSTDSEQLIRGLFRRALSREPSGEELTLLKEMVGDKPTPAATADLLWMVIMLPEFQHIQ